jgi:hypothetical protein
MGASSSIEINKKNGKIYKECECKCICSLTYENYITSNIELIIPCYNCLQDLQNNKYNCNTINKIYEQNKNKNILELIDYDLALSDKWLNESDAIMHAGKRNICYEEFTTNNCNLLEKYNIQIQ